MTCSAAASCETWQIWHRLVCKCRFGLVFRFGLGFRFSDAVGDAELIKKAGMIWRCSSTRVSIVSLPGLAQKPQPNCRPLLGRLVAMGKYLSKSDAVARPARCSDHRARPEQGRHGLDPIDNGLPVGLGVGAVVQVA